MMTKLLFAGFMLLALAGLPALLPAGPEDQPGSDVTATFNLERQYDTEATSYYHSSSRYDGLDSATGGLVYRYVVSGDFRRKVIGPREDGCVLEEFHWKSVKITYYSPRDGTVSSVKSLPFAEGFTYRLCFEDDYNDISELVDHTDLPKTLEGFLFYEQIIDAHSPFDWLLTRKHGLIHRLDIAGTVVELPQGTGVSAVDFRPFGYWQFYPQGLRTAQTARFVGLTLVDGQIAALLETGPTDIPMPFDSTVTMGGATVTQKLITDWWGEVAISLDDHLPLWGQMFERATPLGERNGSGQPIACIQRKLSLSRITATEFGAKEPK